MITTTRLTVISSYPTHSTRFKACKTQPSSDMNWKETFIFQNFPTQQVSRSSQMTLTSRSQ